MDKNKNLTFTHISKEKRIILINSMKELEQAFNKKQQIIALDEKSKVVNPTDGGGTKNTPKWFTDFANQMFEFIKKQEQFNARQEQFNARQEQFNARQEQNWVEQRKFNQYVLDVFKRNNLK